MITSEQIQLGTILQNIADELDIPDGKYRDAIGKYEAVGDWLGREDCVLSKYSPKIFSQGSFRLGTVVKPLWQDEYDIDLVCRLEIPSSTNQDIVYDMIKRRLTDNETYKNMIELKNRCCRLNYAGDFHMDILPAIPDDSRVDASLLVPDRKLSEWKPSNPEGYSEWFYHRMKARREQLIIEAKAEIDDVPEWRIKTPLQRVIQLLKRHRDIVFKDDLENRPLSIIITTLAARVYNNEVYLYDALINIIREMPNTFDNINGHIAVLNPTNNKENFADKWQKYPQRRENFLNWLDGLKSTLFRILELRGLPLINANLETLFEKTAVQGAVLRYAKDIEKQRQKGNLKYEDQTGHLGSKGKSIMGTTFYGE